MRQFATGLNRTWVAILGLVLLVAGLFGAAVGTGLLRQITSTGPRQDDRLLTSGLDDVVTHPAAVWGIGLVGLLLAILGIAWLLAQIPRTNAAPTLRFHDATDGLTTCAPGVVTAAFAEDVEMVDGVTDADAVLRGTQAAPELTLRLTTNDRTDIQQLLATVQDEAVARLETALGRPLHRLAIQVDVSPARRTSDSITL